MVTGVGDAFPALVAVMLITPSRYRRLSRSKNFGTGLGIDVINVRYGAFGWLRLLRLVPGWWSGS